MLYPHHDPFEDTLELSIKKIEMLLEHHYGLSKRSIALLLLQGDNAMMLLIQKEETQTYTQIEKILEETKAHYRDPLSYIIAIRRQEESNRIIRESIEHAPPKRLSLKEKISRCMIHPVTGIPILLLILYYGIYKFVGGFGAGTVVDFIETKIFENHLLPWIKGFIIHLIPWPVLRDLFIGEYGVLTLGFRYAFALILPIVTTFFIVFAIIEDTGYLPRLALLIDRIFKTIGLSGRAVIPMVLGLGCDTMATLVTRTLPTKRERIIATILLALAIPCSAQLGVILSLLEGNPKALWIWLGIIGLVFVFVGFLSSKILPGEAPSFYMEIPPLRLPRFSNIFIKTYSRVEWYLKEIFPIFIFASILIWFGQWIGLFDILVKILQHPIRWIGLPDQASVAFLFGFFRRDYGAAGLYDIKKAGLLSGNQLVVACTTLTLFLPCIAQLLINIKERGLKTGVFISVFILFFSFSVGFIVHCIFTLFSVNL